MPNGSSAILAERIEPSVPTRPNPSVICSLCRQTGRLDKKCNVAGPGTVAKRVAESEKRNLSRDKTEPDALFFSGARSRTRPRQGKHRRRTGDDTQRSQRYLARSCAWTIVIVVACRQRRKQCETARRRRECFSIIIIADEF